MQSQGGWRAEGCDDGNPQTPTHFVPTWEMYIDFYGKWKHFWQQNFCWMQTVHNLNGYNLKTILVGMRCQIGIYTSIMRDRQIGAARIERQDTHNIFIAWASTNIIKPGCKESTQESSYLTTVYGTSVNYYELWIGFVWKRGQFRWIIST